MSAQKLSFRKRSGSKGFQLEDIEGFSSVCSSSRKLKRKREPSYRRVNRYFKSTSQYWKERNRRKKAYHLFSEGFTHHQIAAKLGVCAKTVSRDLKRTRRYHTGRFNKMIRQIEAERDPEYIKRYEKLSLAEQRKQLLEDYKFFAKMFRLRQRLKETMILTISLDEIMRAMRDNNAYGRPFISLHPKTLTLPLNRFRLKVCFTVGERQVGEAVYSVGKW